MLRVQAVCAVVALVLVGCSAHKPVAPQTPPPGVRSLGFDPDNYASKTVGREWFNDRVRDSGLSPRVKP